MIEDKTSKESNNFLFNSESIFSNQKDSIFYTLNQLDQSKALDLTNQLDITHYETILHFGEDIQKDLKYFTHHLLLYVQKTDTSTIHEILSKLIQKLEQINPDNLLENEQSFLKKFFHRPQTSIQQIVSQYNRLSTEIDRLTIHLKRAQNNLLSDRNRLNELYQKNEEYYHEINQYIAALEMKKIDLQKQLKSREEEIGTSTNPMVAQSLSELKNTIEWVERRIYDLQLSREIAIQTAPQIQMIQSTNEMLIEKIQSSIMTTIPLWQSQISMLIHMNRQRRASETSRHLMNTSEKMISKNSAMIKKTSKEYMKQTPITLEEVTQLKQTQLQLIESIEETLQLQAEKNEKQRSFEQTVHQIKE